MLVKLFAWVTVALNEISYIALINFNEQSQMTLTIIGNVSGLI